MKDSAGKRFDAGVAIAFAVAALSLAACGKQNKTGDVAQDSILIKDADLAEHKVNTAAPPTTLVRDRGSVADAPVLTSGAAVKRARSVDAGLPPSGLQPPKRVNPLPVLPGRESTIAAPMTDSPPPPPRTDTLSGY